MQVIILSPIEVEYACVRQFLSNRKSETKEGLVYETGFFQGKHQKYRLAIRQTGSKQADIALATERAIQHYPPDLIILLGVAGGIKDVAIGDVVVGTKAYGYESGKIVKNGMVARPEALPYDHSLIEIARHLSRNETWYRLLNNNQKPIKVVFGPIASGDKVITSSNSPISHFLKQHYNDTKAVEMEAIGFSKALLPYPHIRSMNIRGISDLLDNKTQADLQGNQPKAIKHAATFTFTLLYQLDYSSLKIYAMDAKELAKKIAPLLFPVLKQSAQGIEFTSSKVLQEMWAKLQHLFRQEIMELQESPDDQELLKETVVTMKSKLRKSFKNNEQLQQELSSLLEQVDDKSKQASINISNSKNVIQGSQISVGGNMNLGDQHFSNTST